MTRTRLLAALIMTPLAIAAIVFLSTPWLAVLAAALFLGGLWEWLRLAEVEDTLARTVLLVLNLMLMVAMVWASRTASGGSLVLFQIVSMIGVAWWLLAAAWLRTYDFGSDHDNGARVAKLAAGTFAVVPAWCAAVLLHAQRPNGHWWLLLALLLVWAADTGAYFAGRRFGGKLFSRKLAPRISPNKTIEGVVGGLLLSVAIALVGGTLLGAKAAQLPAIAIVAVATVLFSVVGDLFESLLKRHAGVKDSGNLIPGHGGLLDRMDSVLAALPVFVLGKEWLGF